MTTRMRVAKIPKEELERRCAEGTMYADFVPIGHWVREVDYGNVAHCFCSECLKEGQRTNFCPNCGADMRKDEPGAPITREEVESGITVYVDGKYDPIYLGSSPHDGPMYKCPKCGQVFSSWEWLGKREFTCNCGATWNVPE